MEDPSDIQDIPDDVSHDDQTRPYSALYEKSVAEAQDRDSEWLAKAALVVAGIHGLGRLMGKNLIADAADQYGRFARYAGSFTKPNANISDFTLGKLSSILKTDKRDAGAALKQNTRLDSLPFIQDIAEAVSTLEDPNTALPYAKDLRKKLQTNFQTLMATEPEPNFLHKDLSFLRVSDVLDGTVTLSKENSLEQKLLTKAVDIGLVAREQILDRNLFKDAAGKIMDTRALRPRDFLEATSKIVNPFGLITSLRSFAISNRTFARISAPDVGNSDSYYVGGNVYKANEKGLELTGRNKSLGFINDARHLAASLRETPEVVKPIENATPWQLLQQKIGVGPMYHERRGGIIQTAKMFFKNLYGVSSGKAEMVAKDYKYTHESLYGAVLDPYNYTAVVDRGNAIAEGKFIGQGVLDLNDTLPVKGPVKNARGFTRRIMAYAGLSPDIAIVDKEAVERVAAGGSALNKSDLYVDFGRAGVDSLERPIGVSANPTGVSSVGKLDYMVRPQNYAASSDSIDRVYDFANWMTIRLNKLASVSLGGIGFKPSGNLLANTLRVAAIPSSYYLAKEAIKYADYGIENVLGKGPIEAAADVYTYGRVKQQEFREATGTTKLASYIQDDLLPGVDLGILGTLGSAIGGVSALEKTGKPLKALGVASAIYGFFGGSNVEQTPESLEREYAGEEKVAVRKGRWWLLGYQPFKGGDVDYYKPSWYTELKADPYNTSVYGSKENYWKYGSMLPNPTNWFGLRHVLDPYALERLNYYDRPYPVSAKMFEEVPVIGPILADTVGELIKPTKVMHPEEQSNMIASSNLSQRGVPTNAARMLGIPDVPVTVVDLNRPDVTENRYSKWANVALEPSGVWKFALGLFGVNFNEEYELASANNMSSVARKFYDMNLGGFFGETEFLRRFMLSEYASPSKINQQINPIKNTMPRWLPGSDSETESDRQYFVDFNRGDAYTKLPGGEFRLPGPGYESVNRLHSGVSNVYSDVDKYLVLADIAPYSASYFKYEAVVNKMELSPYWKWKVTQAKEQRENKVTKPEFNGTSQEQIAEANRNILTRGVRRTWETIREEGLSNIPIVGAKVFPHTNPFDKYVADQVEGETFADWKNPIETIVRPEFYTTIGESPFFAAKRGLNLGSLVASRAGSFLNPFPALTDNPKTTALMGAGIGFVGSLARAAGTGSWSHGFVPPHVEKERETEEYFDYLKYAKARYLQSTAEEQGNEQLAETFKLQAQSTLNYGLAVFKNTGDVRRYQSALPKEERPYFDAFMKAPGKKRDDILNVVPGHMKEVLQAVWASQEGRPNKEPQFEESDEQALKYFQNHQLPDQDWVGWSPTVPDMAIKIKAVSAGINGVSSAMHRFGAFPMQVKEANVRFSYLEPPPTDIRGQNEASIRLMASSMLNREVGNPFSSVGHRRVSHGVGPKVDWFSAYIEDSRRNDMFTFYQDAYR